MIARSILRFEMLRILVQGSPKPKIGPLNILVSQDRNMGFAASIAVKRFGVEADNNITWVTGDAQERFRSYPTAKKNFRAAQSTGCLTTYFGLDLLSQEPHVQLKQHSYHKIYLICPQFSEEVKAVEEHDGDACDDDEEDDDDDEEEEDDDDDDEEAKELAFQKQEKEQSKPEVIAKNQEFVRDLMRKAASLISNDGVIIVLHHTPSPYSEWKLDEIAAENKLEKLEDCTPFDLNKYPHLKGSASDLKLKRIPSAFHCYGKKKM